ncbi:MAG: hypothetical protein JOZ98_08775 [Solirubrobacterales bacterium]|nr:hypothetical protein [Solirubrobacterales bacterium]
MTPTTPPVVVVPPKEPPVKKAKKPTHVTQRIIITGAPIGCATSALRLRIRIELSPRGVASRRLVHGALAVRVITAVKLDGRQIAVSRRRSFSLTVALSRFAVGRHTLTFTTTTRGPTVRGSRKTRTARFSRCAPVPLFTG